MVIDPATTKYLIKAHIKADGIIEKSDVVGAIFGQTEGLLGDVQEYVELKLNLNPKMEKVREKLYFQLL